jgi:hypothetical protein
VIGGHQVEGEILMRITTPPLSEVLVTLERDGIYVLNQILSAGDIEAIRAEAEWFLSAQQPWYKLGSQGPESFAVVSPRSVPHSALDRSRNIATLFSNSFFERVCKSYLGNDAIIDRIIFSRSKASERPITLWHTDQQSEGRLSFKFMLYLTDASEDTGAFSYVPGSHAMMRILLSKAAKQGIPNTDLHTFEQIVDNFKRFGSDEEKAWFADITRHITGDFASDDHFSVAAKQGSILLFDTKGMHRGGVVRHGERLLVRLHCFEPERRNKRRSWPHRAVNLLRMTLKPNLFGWG